MRKVLEYTLAVLALLVSVGEIAAADDDSLVVDHADWTEVLLVEGEYVVTFVGDVKLRTSSARIYCDSAEYRQGQSAWLRGDVFVDDTAYSLRADSVWYNLTEKQSTAWGDRVELWSFADSLYASGTHAIYNRGSRELFMDERPTVYLRYPDTANWVEVVGDTIEYTAEPPLAVASGEAVISSTEMSTYSGIATLDMDSGTLVLEDEPRASYGQSTISGRLIEIGYQGDLIESIVVTDSAEGNLRQPADEDSTWFDESILSGDRLVFGFDQGELVEIVTHGQAYSWYYPSPQGGSQFHENSVSGDTIRFVMSGQEELEAVQVIGSAIGAYVSGRTVGGGGTVGGAAPDTVDYSANYIEYNLADSMILLVNEAGVKSGTVELTSEQVLFDTGNDMIKAYSAEAPPDTALDEFSFTSQAQPNPVPVILLDGEQKLVGDYLEYSIETEKGRFIQSKTEYDPGYYYGQKLFREQENIFYVRQGRFTTCDLDEPHFHFRSSSLKLIENDKLIARPVVAYVGRLPVFALPYFVFPLERGRHSGFLDFEFGNFERDVRYVKNVGYYWAASDYWDWQGAFDYYDDRNTFTLRSIASFAKRYVIENTYVEGQYTRRNVYNRAQATEGKNTDFTLKGAYNHQVTPSFKVAGYGEYISSSNYYSIYSNNLEERLNRELKSRLSVKKEWRNGISLTADAQHTVNMDQEWRTDYYPNASVSLPTIYPFGSGEAGERSWYNDFRLRYTPSLVNYSRRDTRDTGFVYYTVVDSSFSEEDSTWTVVTDTTGVDTLSYRTRKHYAKINHSPSLTLPSLSLGNYLTVVPRIGYNETWYYIYETDQSDSAGIIPTNYRTYSWNASVSASSKMYGTVYPNLFGLSGLRHVFEPRVAYTYSPEANRHPEIRSFAGGGAGNASKSQTVSISLIQDFMAKLRSGETEKSYNLLNLSSGFSYNFENEDRPFSDLRTTYRSDIVPRVSINGTIVHDLYRPDTDELNFWSPYMKSFTFNASATFRGSFSLFDPPAEPAKPSQGTEEAPEQTGGSSSSSGTWTCSIDYRYGESGRGENWQKTADYFGLNISVNFKLTPSTTVSYSQYFDVRKARTIHNSVRIARQIHCWTGSLYWVPVGSNRGFGFKLFVTGLPDIKIDNSHDSRISGITARY